jgi:hypothetical protein
MAVPSLAAIVALASWGFQFGVIYWRAVQLCFITLASLYVAFILIFLVIGLWIGDVEKIGDLQTTAWGIAFECVFFAVQTFAMFAFVIRATIANLKLWVPMAFLALGVVTGFLSEKFVDPFDVTFPVLLGVSALTSYLSRKGALESRLQTLLIESR